MKAMNALDQSNKASDASGGLLDAAANESAIQENAHHAESWNLAPVEERNAVKEEPTDDDFSFEGTDTNRQDQNVYANDGVRIKEEDIEDTQPQPLQIYFDDVMASYVGEVNPAGIPHGKGKVTCDDGKCLKSWANASLCYYEVTGFVSGLPSPDVDHRCKGSFSFQSQRGHLVFDR